jgi:hypothetical protein
MGNRIVTALWVLLLGAAPSSALEIEFTDFSTSTTLTVVDGSAQDQYGSPSVPDGVVGRLNSNVGNLAVRFVRCTETKVPGTSVALVIDQSVASGGFTNAGGPSYGETGAREFRVDCRSGTIVPGISDWRISAQYLGDVQDDSIDEVALPTHFATVRANGTADVLATVYGPSIFPAVPVGPGQPVAWGVRSIEPTDDASTIDSLQLRLDIAPRGRDRVEIDRVLATASRTQLACTAKKINCVRKAVHGLLRCHRDAEVHGTTVDPACISRFEDDFDGGAVPADGCFEGYEATHLPTAFQSCATYDDQAALDATLGAFVADVLAALGTPTQNVCAAKKKDCVIKLQNKLLNCHKKANTSGDPVDFTCVRKALDKFTGGATPSKGCFAKLETKFPASSSTPCLTFGDAAAIGDRVREFVGCVAGKLGDPSGAPCVDGVEQGCGLPRCKNTGGQRPDCTYTPAVTTPRYGTCRGPLILVDRTHNNFHNVTPENATYKGRYWGFANLLMADGYDVRDSTEPFTTLLPSTTAEILVIANTKAEQGQSDAVPAAEVTDLVNWVTQGGKLLLIADHPPYNKIGLLLQAFGIQRFASNSDDPPCSLSSGPATCWTFTRASGSLNPSSVIANGFAAGEDINEVSTFFGTFYAPLAMPPVIAQYEGVLVFPPGSVAHGLPIAGFWQGVAIQFGAGKVYLAGEAGSLTAQNTFGMQITPDNEQYVLNIAHWLDL